MLDNTNHGDGEKQPSTDVLFAILSSKRRRLALYCLEKYRTPMALADLADEVARLEYDADMLLQVSKEAVKDIYLDLYHTHIPKMEEANLLDYSQEQDSVYLRYELSDLQLEEVI